MKKTLLKAIGQVERDYEVVDKNEFGDYLLILKRVISIAELFGLENFDQDFRHIYRAALIYENTLPTDENAESSIPGIKRELNYLVSQLRYIVNKK